MLRCSLDHSKPSSHNSKYSSGQLLINNFNALEKFSDIVVNDLIGQKVHSYDHLKIKFVKCLYTLVIFHVYKIWGMYKGILRFLCLFRTVNLSHTSIFSVATPPCVNIYPDSSISQQLGFPISWFTCSVDGIQYKHSYVHFNYLFILSKFHEYLSSK